MPMCLCVHRSTLRSPLFPYTTLFRSFGGRCDGKETQEILHDIGSSLGVHPPLGKRTRLHQVLHGEAIAPGGPVLDRKSTRLNSSHTVISYAVFCLKKKMATVVVST